MDYTVNLVKLATEKTQNFYYNVIISDLNQRNFPFCGYQCSSPCCKFYYIDCIGGPGRVVSEWSLWGIAIGTVWY